MTVELASLSVSALHRLEEDVRLELQRRHDRRIIEARNAVYAIAKRLNMDVQDLLGRHSRDIQEPPQMAVKYRNPDNHQQQWTGRGRKPDWVVAWLSGGKTLSELSD